MFTSQGQLFRWDDVSSEYFIHNDYLDPIVFSDFS